MSVARQISIARQTWLFAALIFAGYQVGFVLAYKFFPSSLYMVLLPPWITALGVAFITLPIAAVHSMLVHYFLRKVSDWRSTRKSANVANMVTALSVSTLLVAPIIAGISWLSIVSVRSSFGDMSNVIMPEGPAFTVSNAVANMVLKYSVTFLIAAWGSTCLLLSGCFFPPSAKLRHQSVCG